MRLRLPNRTSTRRSTRHAGGARHAAWAGLLALGLAYSGGTQVWAQTEWRAGLASVDITPHEPVPMAGYASRKAPFETVAHPISAKMLALEDGDGNKALLITADILGFTAERSAEIARRLQESDGIVREDILLNASHTHSGPLVAGSMLTMVDDEMRDRLLRYSEILNDKIVAGAQKALQDLRPANLSWGQGVAKFVMNRREFTEDRIILGTNPRGPADRTVPVLRIDGTNGQPRAIVFGAASHCTTLTGGNMSISGDYAGVAQIYIEARRPGVQAMFVTGCAGDANPFPRGTLDIVRRHGSDLAEEVLRVAGRNLKEVRGPLTTEFEMVDLPLIRYSKEDVVAMKDGAPSYRTFFTDGAESIFDKGEQLPRTYSAPFAVWQFGDDLTLVAYSGETLVEYALGAERHLGKLNLWVSGYNNDVFGYLPSAQVVKEGGYESRGLYVDYGLFRADVEKVVLDAIVEMARKAGRMMPR